MSDGWKTAFFYHSYLRDNFYMLLAFYKGQIQSPNRALSHKWRDPF